jgi:nucleotide-binding universal stress UspA family protein
MVKTILVSTDGSDCAAKAVRFAADLARACDADLIALHVMAALGGGKIPKNLEEFARAEHIQESERSILESVGEQVLRGAEVAAREKGASRVETQLEMGDAAATILEVAKARGADVIVLGSRGLGDLQGLMLGSVSHKVAHLAPCTCITVK